MITVEFQQPQSLPAWMFASDRFADALLVVVTAGARSMMPVCLFPTLAVTPSRAGAMGWFSINSASRRQK
jgi:hypothetical protein